MIGVTLLSLSAALVHSQDVPVSTTAPSTSNAEEATPELQARWEYFVPVPIPAAKTDDSPTLVDLILGKEVFAHARPNLADLRLFDTTGKTIPYSCATGDRKRSARTWQRPSSIATNRTTVPTN